MDIALSYLMAGVIGYLGYRAQALTWDGAAAACLVGGTIFGFGGPGWAVLLVVFFVSSSMLSLVGRNDPRKKGASEAFEKGGRRDAWQVLANGGVAALAALGAGVVKEASLLNDLQLEIVGLSFAAFVGALAAATADTWATEIGVLSRTSPRLVTTWRHVRAGTSGGITTLGSVAALLGAGLIGLTAIAVLVAYDYESMLVLISMPSFHYGAVLLVAFMGGLGGMVADSLLGATVQAQYVCPACNKPTESRVHRCGSATRLVGGVPWINNDFVNMAGTLVGGLIGLGVALI
jgi:uncharacterized protein (TIGR00297 family)